jgi:hypothetical protein
MLHLADLITELNGTALLPHCPSTALLVSYINVPFRLLRSHVYLLLDAILPWASLCTCKSLGRVGFHALWVILRFHGWQGSKVEEEE